MKTGNHTSFAQMSVDMMIWRGVHNQNLQIKSPGLRATGKNREDSPGQHIDYLLNASIVKTGPEQGGKNVSELKSLAIPIKAGGTFARPAVYGNISLKEHKCRKICLFPGPY